MPDDIYRKVAIERLSSPEQLDQLMKVVSVRLWASLTAILIVLGIAIVWGFIGAIVDSANGQGIIVRTGGGVFNLVSSGGGAVLTVNARVGETIHIAQTVATLAQPVLAERVRALQQARDEAIREREESSLRHTQSAKLQTAALQRQEDNSNLQIKELTEQSIFAEERIAADDQLMTKGLITKQQAISSHQKLTTIKDQIATLKAEIIQIDAQLFAARSQPREDDTALKDKVAGLSRDLAEASKELAIGESVRSPFEGEVLEVKVDPGSIVSTGQPILSLQPNAQDLEVISYLPASTAKDIRPGMEVQISPSEIKREEYGFLRANVIAVAEYPATPEAMMRNFQNDTLVRALTTAGPVTEIRVGLQRDANTPSGYRWSASHGPKLKLSSGTLCTTRFVTKRRRPISLLLPILKQTVGVD